MEHGEALFIAVGTPPDENGSADLRHVLAAASHIGKHINGFKVVVDKSTVPVGTAELVASVIDEELLQRAHAGDAHGGCFSVVSNPEFLKEGAAIEDFMRPDRIVLGVDGDRFGQRALEVMRKLYAPFNRNHERTRVMNVRSAEFTKYAANAMLATRISFMNELANLAEKFGVDIELVRQGIGSDPRIGYSFLYAGAGFGGSCFPKILSALVEAAKQVGMNLRILESVITVNKIQPQMLVSKVLTEFGQELTGRTFALWGLAFKPNTDDMREAPSLSIVASLLRHGARITAHDPVAMDAARRALHIELIDQPGLLDNVIFCENHLNALEGADALIIVTEWKAYKSPNLSHVKRQLKGSIIFDGRNIYEPGDVAAAGLRYVGIGRSS